MNPTLRKPSGTIERAILALVLLIDVVMFGVVPILQVLLIMTTNVTEDLSLAKLTASLVLAVFCMAGCYWVWKREAGAAYLLLTGITISSIITTALKISVLRDAGVTNVETWTLVQYFVPALFCFVLNWVYFVRAGFRLRRAAVGVDDLGR
jgi:hypothetical protein